MTQPAEGPHTNLTFLLRLHFHPFIPQFSHQSPAESAGGGGRQEVRDGDEF